MLIDFHQTSKRMLAELRFDLTTTGPTVRVAIEDLPYLRSHILMSLAAQPTHAYFKSQSAALFSLDAIHVFRLHRDLNAINLIFCQALPLIYANGRK